MSYKTFEEFFSKALSYLGVEWDNFENDFGNDLREIKATRNTILHNDLKDESRYKEAAKINSRSKLDIDYDYTSKSIDLMLRFEETLKDKLKSKYCKYTKIAAIKRLWEFTFTTPIMPFDDFWEYDTNKGHIYRLKKGKYEESISHSERVLLKVWRNLFNGSDLDSVVFKSIYGGSLEKMLFLISKSEDFDFE